MPRVVVLFLILLIIYFRSDVAIQTYAKCVYAREMSSEAGKPPSGARETTNEADASEVQVFMRETTIYAVSVTTTFHPRHGHASSSRDAPKRDDV